MLKKGEKKKRLKRENAKTERNSSLNMWFSLSIQFPFVPYDRVSQNSAVFI